MTTTAHYVALISLCTIAVTSGWFGWELTASASLIAVIAVGIHGVYWEVAQLSPPTTDDERYVCMPCRELVPNREGEIVVSGGGNDPVWCPWCGDKMERYGPEVHGE